MGTTQLPITTNYPSEKQYSGHKDKAGINSPQAIPLPPKPQFFPPLVFRNSELLTSFSHEDRKPLTIECLHKVIMDRTASQPKNTIKKNKAVLPGTLKEILDL